MHHFFFPHQLIAPINLYIAALHRDSETAYAAFSKWINQLDIEKIDFHQHKLIGLVASRFENELAGHSQVGVIQNIRRHGRLRAHANLNVLRKFLVSPGISELGLIAIGEIRECILTDISTIGDFDSFELAISTSQLNAALESLPRTGWEIQHPPIQPRGRHVSFVSFHQPHMKVFLKVFAITNPCIDNKVFANYKGISVLTDIAHGNLMRSRAAGLMARRDQFLFDIYRSRQALSRSEDFSRIGVGNLPWLFRFFGGKILG